MNETPNLNLPYLLAAQAQKHVTHNEAIRALDAIIHLSVEDRDLDTPPETPTEGSRYLIASGATGTWAGKDGNIAAFQDGAWLYYTPRQGWITWISDEATALAFDGTAWVSVSGATTFESLIDTPETFAAAAGKLARVNIGENAIEFSDEVPQLGIAATPDDTNRLTVAAPASLFNHAGNGHQIKLNKNAVGDTASVLFQTGFSGRAEFGLTGDDNWHVKVSPDGETWREALIADRLTGEIAVNGIKSVPANYAKASSIIFTPGGAGVVTFYRIDTSSTANPRTVTVGSISGDTITLSAANADTIFGSNMTGVSYIRIWNTTQSADAHSAWVKAKPSSSSLQVTDAAAISGWAPGDTIQVGDPTTITPNRCITMDISPMLINLFGQAFRQSGVIIKGTFYGGTEGDTIDVTPAGETGSFVSVAKVSVTGVAEGDGTTIIPCTELSPISNSNLVRVRESIGTTATTRLLSSIAVLV